MYNRETPLNAGMQSGQQDRDMVDLRQLFRTLWRRKGLVILTTLLFAGVAYYLVSQIPPSYTSLAKVMLDPQRSQVTGDQKVVSDLEINDAVINSEAAVLSSNILIESVINDIGFDRLESLDPMNMPPSIQSRLRDFLRAQGILAAAEDAPTMLFEEQRLERMIAAIRKRISVRRQGTSLVIGIWVTTHDPELSALLARTISQEYIEDQLRYRQSVVQDATIWIEGRLQVLRRDLEQAEAAAVAYRLESLSKDGSSVETISQQLTEFSLRAAEAQVERTIAEASLRDLERLIEEEGILAAGKKLTSPTLETLNAQRVNLVLQDGVWSRDFGEDHPNRKRLIAEIAVIDTEYEREIEKIVAQQRSNVRRAQALEESVQKRLEEMEERVIDISTNSIELEELQRNIDVSQNEYEELLNRLTETRSQELLQKADARIIEQATIAGPPSAPRPKLITAMGASVGLIVGLGPVFFLEMTNQTFRTEKDLESETGLPLLASLQKVRWRGLRRGFTEVLLHPNGDYAERIGQMRTTLMTQNPDGRSYTYLVTSSTPNEGKTTTTLNLAAMMAKAGKSVIVLDCDLRRSTIGKGFGWKPTFGFSQYLRGECSLRDVIHTDTDLPYDVLASTGGNANIVDILTEQKLTDTINELKKHYNIILIDSPPVLSVSDSLLLVQAVDQIVFVVRWNVTPKAAVTKAVGLLRNAKSVPAGAVLNVIDPKECRANFTGNYSYEA
ncbi:GumC family protein [Falsihalocynthiibacter sp. SS001]|uniref:GumC family protein n=1 Tax=Falsihalocynthiibacter sp. SS001 TaxID=3349698 RepID=UPI0036D29A76